MSKVYENDQLNIIFFALIISTNMKWVDIIV